jgi:hypothetical protein
MYVSIPFNRWVTLSSVKVDKYGMTIVSSNVTHTKTNHLYSPHVVQSFMQDPVNQSLMQSPGKKKDCQS